MKHTLNIKVRYNETDQMAVVYHANYIVWFELARQDFVEKVGYTVKELETLGVMFPVVSVNAFYKNPVRFGDDVKVETSVVKFTKIKTIYKHEVYTNGVLACTGESVIAHVSTDTFMPVDISKYNKDLYEAYRGLENEVN